MDFEVRAMMQQEHCKDLLREAAQERLAQEALAGRNEDQRLLCQMLRGLGKHLVTCGQWLQNRFAAARPTPPFVVSERAQ